MFIWQKYKKSIFTSYKSDQTTCQTQGSAKDAYNFLGSVLIYVVVSMNTDQFTTGTQHIQQKGWEGILYDPHQAIVDCAVRLENDKRFYKKSK